jgi:hypothetical protein
VLISARNFIRKMIYGDGIYVTKGNSPFTRYCKH